MVNVIPWLCSLNSPFFGPPFGRISYRPAAHTSLEIDTAIYISIVLALCEWDIHMETNRVGQQLGNYYLVRLLRRGGFAEVYLGKQIYLETYAAIKILRKQLGNEERKNFLREARTIAHLVHPHIIRVLDFGVDGYTPFLVMDYAPQGTLRQHYPKGTPLPLPTTISYVKQLASALQYAHHQNLVHCDVKPENMLFGRHGEVLLSDFGIAFTPQPSTVQETQEPLGTVAYMAPEQILGEPCPASDQYSLGIVVYEWLCGERPFQGPLTEIVQQQLTATPPSLQEKAPDLPPDIQEVIAIALAKDPHKRFVSVKAFAHALEQASRLEPHQLPVPDFELPTASLKEVLHVTKPLPETVPPLVAPRQPTKIVQTPSETGLLSSSGSATPGRSALNTPVIMHSSMESKPKFSRRTVVAGLFGFALAGSGSVALFLQHLLNRSAVIPSHTAHHIPGPTPTPTPTFTPTPTLPPLGTTLYTYQGHHEVVKAVAWSPSGPSLAPAGTSRIASASFDSTVQVWDATTGNHILKYSQHTAGVKTVAWSPDGAHIASGGLDIVVRVWDVVTGKDILPPYRGHTQAVRSVAWSPDSSHIASGSEDNTVQVWDATTGKTILIYRGHSDKVIRVAWSPDGSRIASASFDGTVQVWHVNPDGNFLAYSYRGHYPNGVRAAAWSPDGKYIASAGNDATVQLWDAKTGQTIVTYLGHTQEVEIVTWSPDGKYLASGSFDATVKIWDSATGRNIFTYTHDSDQVWAVGWSSDGQHIASGGNDMIVHVWQTV